MGIFNYIFWQREHLRIALVIFLLLLTNFDNACGAGNQSDQLAHHSETSEVKDSTSSASMKDLPNVILLAIIAKLEQSTLRQAREELKFFCDKQDELVKAWRKLLDEKWRFEERYYDCPMTNWILDKDADLDLRTKAMSPQCDRYNIWCTNTDDCDRFECNKEVERKRIYLPTAQSVGVIRQLALLGATSKRLSNLVAPLITEYKAKLPPLKGYPQFIKQTLLCLGLETNNFPLAKLSKQMGVNIDITWNAIERNDVNSLSMLIDLGATFRKTDLHKMDASLFAGHPKLLQLLEELEDEALQKKLAKAEADSHQKSQSNSSPSDKSNTTTTVNQDIKNVQANDSVVADQAADSKKRPIIARDHPMGYKIGIPLIIGFIFYEWWEYCTGALVEPDESLEEDDDENKEIEVHPNRLLTKPGV